MNILRKIVHACKYFFEIFMPVATFVVLFISFIIGIFMRYIPRNPQPWTYELSQICFLWCVLFATCTAQREEEHIVFSMVYDELKPREKNIFRIISNAIIITFLAIAVPPSVRYLLRLTVLTSVLKIPRSIVFVPYVIVFVITIIRCMYRVIEDIKTFRDKTFEQNYNKGEKEIII